MSNGQEHIDRIRQIAAHMGDQNANFEVNFGNISVEFAQLLHALSEKLDSTQHRVRILNIWIALLTAVLVAATLAEIIHPFR